MPSLRGAIEQAQRICWDESIGYYFGGYSDSMGYDCSGLVCRVLYDNGFNVTNTRVGTAYLTSHLVNAGFIHIPYTSGMVMQHGDIVNINDGSYGHSYIYAENVNGYYDFPAGTDSSHPNDSAWNVTTDIRLLNYAKIEAYSSNGRPQAGDNPNSYGAHCEVWVHRLNPSNITNGHPDNTCDILRWPYEYDRDSDGGIIAALKILKFI